MFFHSFGAYFNGIRFVDLNYHIVMLFTIFMLWRRMHLYVLFNNVLLSIWMRGICKMLASAPLY